MIERSKKQKKLGFVFVATLMLFVSLFTVLPVLPVFNASADSDDYEAFNDSIMDMLKENDDWTESEIVTLSDDEYMIEGEEVLIKENALENLGLKKNIKLRNSLSDEFYSVSQLSDDINVKIEDDNVILEKQPEINRLIVNSESKLKSCGAVAKAEYNDWHIFQYDSAEKCEKAYDYYSSLGNVTVSYDYVISADGEEVEADATYTYQSWGASYVGYNDYTNTMLDMFSQSDLPTVYVPVLDSGIYTSHELFKNRIAYSYAKNFTTEVSKTNYEFEDYNGHGTHVSGTIAEATLSNVKIVPLKVLMSDGKGLVVMIVNALNYVKSLKINDKLPICVINMSIGVDTKSSTSGVSARSSSLTKAVIDVYNSGVLPVVSAGNERQNTIYANPANIDEAITVSALEMRYSFPNGVALYFDNSYSNYGKHVDLSAPGTGIKSAGIAYSTQYVTMNGTSMAAPHVTACAALLYSNPNYFNYTVEQMTDLLEQNAIDLGDPGRDDYYGYGLVNIAKIGVINTGYVEFSCEEPFPQTAINVTLGYDTTVEAGENLKIYYTTDENADDIDLTSSQVYVYNKPISITKTTKLTAMAYVYNSSGGTLKKSFTKSFTYYFDNIDLNCNYDFNVYTTGYMISKYNGILTTLNVPESVDGHDVIGVESLAFNSSNVKTLYLPETVSRLNESAFNGNINLQSIYCDNKQIKIGDSAFRKCYNLSNLQLKSIISIGNYSFANCTSIESLYLPNVTTIGNHAFSASSIKGLFLGDKLESIGNQTDLSLDSVIGYANTPAKKFADDNKISFTDLTLRITENLGARKIIRQSDTLNLELAFTGYEASYEIEFTGASHNISSRLEVLNDYDKILKTTIFGLDIGNYDLVVNLTDKFSNKISSNIIKIYVVSDSAETYSINFDENNFMLYVNDELTSPSSLLFKGFDYNIRIQPNDGYLLKKITINDIDYPVNKEIKFSSVDSDLNISVQTAPKSNLSIVFDTADKGVIVVEDSIVGDTLVERNGSVSFRVVPNEGFLIKNVMVGNELVFADEFGIYHIDDIISDKKIVISFEEAFYQISVALGKGGNISSSGGQVDVAAHGSSRTFIISTNDGYKVDFVSVNGKKIELKNNSFKLENIDEDCEIIVSFEKERTSLFSGDNSIIFAYFMIFLALFVVFLISKLVLSIMRRMKIS